MAPLFKRNQRPPRTALLLRKGGREGLEHSKALIACRVRGLCLAHGKRAEAARTGRCTHERKEEGQQQSSRRSVLSTVAQKCTIFSRRDNKASPEVLSTVARELRELQEPAGCWEERKYDS